MLRPRTCAALLLITASAACGSSHSVDNSNPAIAGQVEAAADNISVTDGRKETSQPMTPEDAGAAMRSSAAQRPPAQP